MNDLPAIVSGEYVTPYMYDDDLAVQISWRNSDTFHGQINSCNSVINDCCCTTIIDNISRNCLNSVKTQNLEFRLSCDIRNCNQIVILQIPWCFLQPITKWNIHVVCVGNSISKVMFLLRKLKPIVRVHVLISVYSTLWVNV